MERLLTYEEVALEAFCAQFKPDFVNVDVLRQIAPRFPELAAALEDIPASLDYLIPANRSAPSHLRRVGLYWQWQVLVVELSKLVSRSPATLEAALRRVFDDPEWIRERIAAEEERKRIRLEFGLPSEEEP